MAERDKDRDSSITQEADVRNFNFHLFKADNDLFDENKNKPNKVISVKRIKQTKNNEDWAILENGKIVLRMKGSRFTNSEKEFLRTVDGFNFLITEYKNGTSSVTKFKEKIKKFL
jgi:hypothetical protein